MSSEEFTAWCAFLELEPIGWKAELWGHAVVASTIANTVPRRAGVRPFAPADFLPPED